MRDKPLSFVLLVLSFAIYSLAGCVLRHDISGMWKERFRRALREEKKSGKDLRKLTLNQNGDALTGTLVFYASAGRTRPSSDQFGRRSKDAVTFSGQKSVSIGGSIEITFHGRVSGTSLSGTTDMTSRGYLEPSQTPGR